MNRRRRRRRKRTAPTLAPAKKFVYSCAACAGPGQRNGRKAQRPARSLGPKRRPRAAAFRALGPCSAPSATPPPSLARAPAPPTNAELERRAPGGRALAKRAGEAPRGAPPTFPARPNGPQRGQRNQSTQLHQRNAGKTRSPTQPRRQATRAKRSGGGTAACPKARAQCARRAPPAPRLRQEWVGLSGGPRIVGLRDSPDGASRGGKAPSFPRRQNQERAPRKKSPKLSFHGARP